MRRYRVDTFVSRELVRELSNWAEYLTPFPSNAIGPRGGLYALAGDVTMRTIDDPWEADIRAVQHADMRYLRPGTSAHDAAREALG